MRNKDSVNNKVNTLQEFCMQNGKNITMLVDLLAPLQNAIKNYYEIDIFDNLNGVIEAEFHDFLQRNIKFVDDIPGNFSTNFPDGYTKISDLFSPETALMAVAENTFCDSIRETTVTNQATQISTTIYKSALVDAYVADFTQGAATLPGKLTALDEWCRGQTTANKMLNLLEERKVLSAPTKNEIVEELYIKRGFLELIRTLGLRNYIPKAYRNA